MPSDKMVAKDLYLTKDGTRLHITEMEDEVENEHADITDSSNYDAATDLIYKAQIKVSCSVKRAIKGFYYKSQTPTAVIADLLNGTAGPYVIAGGSSSANLHFGGSYDIENFKLTHSVEDATEWEADLMSNGKVNANS